MSDLLEFFRIAWKIIGESFLSRGEDLGNQVEKDIDDECHLASLFIFQLKGQKKDQQLFP